MRSPLFVLLASAACPAAVSGEPLVIASATPDQSGERLAIELIATNPAPTARRIDVAPVLDAALIAPDGARTPVQLERADDQPATVAMAPTGFARLRYILASPRIAGGGPITLVLPGAPAVALVLPASETRVAAATPPPAAPTAPLPTPPSAEPPHTATGFLANLSTYQPIYAVYGPGTNSDARLQISFKYQLFGTAGARASWLDGLMFGYTQQMFWDLGHASAPFRDVNYMPELYYQLPRVATIGGWTIDGRAGLRHQSNGRAGAASHSLNIAYIEPEVRATMGGIDVALGPSLWAYVGRRSDNPDIGHYRGNAGLFARIGAPDGVQLYASGRLNPTSGKGAAEALISYPLTRLFADGPKLYLFGQGFAGYGEDLLDYDRRQTRLRIGFGLTR